MSAGQRPTASYRVNRGGSYANDASNLASAYRDNNSPDNRNNNLGFRLALAQSRARDSRGIDPVAVLSQALSLWQKLSSSRPVLVAWTQRRTLRAAVSVEQGRVSFLLIS